MRHFDNNEYKTKNRKTCTCLTVPVIYIVDLTGIVHSADESVGKPVQITGSRRTVGYLGDLSGQKSIFEKSTEVEHKVT